MKIIIPIAAAVALAITGCSAPSSAPQETVTVTATAPAPEPVIPDNDFDTPSMSDDETFLMLLRGEDPIFNAISDRTLIDLGRTTCDAFDAGMTLEMYASVAAQSDITTDQAATIAAASIVVYCPWHEGIAG